MNENNGLWGNGSWQWHQGFKLSNYQIKTYDCCWARESTDYALCSDGSAQNKFEYYGRAIPYQHWFRPENPLYVGGFIKGGK